MRLIADGVVDREGVDGLAARLGYTRAAPAPRAHRRARRRSARARPGARAQTARALLTVDGPCPLADVAFAAGFGSIRQFNDTVARCSPATPARAALAARLRDRGTRAHSLDGEEHGSASPGTRETGAEPHAGVVRLRLPARAPFDAAGVFDWLATRALDGVERTGPLHYARTLRLPGGPAARASSRPAATRLAPSIDVEARLATLADLPPLVARVRRLFDLDADAVAIDSALAVDPRARALRRGACPASGCPDASTRTRLVFRALVGQQVSVKAARTALARLAADLGERVARPRTGDSPTPALPHLAAIAAEGERSSAARPPASARSSTSPGALDAGDLVVAAERERAELARDLLAVPRHRPMDGRLRGDARDPCARRAAHGRPGAAQRRGRARPAVRGRGTAGRGRAVGAVAQLRVDAPLARRIEIGCLRLLPVRCVAWRSPTKRSCASRR